MIGTRQFPWSGAIASVVTCAIAICCVSPVPAAQGDWLGPSCLAISPDGNTLYVGCAKAERLLLLDLRTRSAPLSISTPSAPTGIALSKDGSTAFVTCSSAKGEGRLLVVNTGNAKITASIATGHGTQGPAVSSDGRTVYVCNRFNDEVGVVDVSSGKVTQRIPVRREPVAAALTADGSRLLVANHIPDGPANSGHVAACLSVIDTAQRRAIGSFSLPSGSTFVNDVQVSPDGKFAAVSHLLARFHLPTTQLDRGWMMTNAKTLVDLERLEILNTVLLDTVDRGAANPWGVAWSADSRRLAVALAGTHEVSVTDFPALLAKLKALPLTLSQAGQQSYSASSRSAADVMNDLAFLVGVRERRALPKGDLGPRAMVAAGSKAYTANYFSDTISVVDLENPETPIQTIPLGPAPRLDLAQRGELNFHDARNCFQGWQSCASCHPGDARVDGLNWDLLNDGIGNPKNTKSLLLAFSTPPAMSAGVRESAEAAVRAGIRHILFLVLPPEVPESMDAYLKALKPVPSPKVVAGRLSESARRGQKLFRDKRTGCIECHSGALFTDLQSYDVGTAGAYDRETTSFDTPTLIELWRTAPYLHDGSAATVRDVLTEANREDKHGRTSHLTGRQIDDLVEYLLSL